MKRQVKSKFGKATLSILILLSIFFSVVSTAAAEEDNVNFEDGGVNGGRNNIVKVVNKKDNDLQVKGRIQLNQINSQSVKPVNEAYAYASCQYCQTFAVALQIDFYNKSANEVSPVNMAIAVNYQCSHCLTVALAYQYAIPVGKSGQVSDDVDELIREMQRELKDISHAKGISLTEVENRLSDVINRFNELSQYLTETYQVTSQEDSPGANQAN